MKKKDIIYVLVILLLTIGMAYFLVENVHLEVSQPSSKIDTITYVDTIPYYKPVPKDSIVIRYQTVKLPVQTKDTIAGSVDSAEVVIPIIQQEYRDSTYHAWVSGYLPRLDSIHVYGKNTVITKTQTVTVTQYKTKRWGVGVQVGYGYSFNKFSPYIGIGVQYNILNW